jgi:hypothetical protein
MTEVASLLQRSRAAHLAKKRAVFGTPDYPKAEAHIREAIAYRKAAEALDSAHADPCWSEDRALNQGVASADLLAWFQRYLTIP